MELNRLNFIETCFIINNARFVDFCILKFSINDSG